jgi:hypothetical protein
MIQNLPHCCAQRTLLPSRAVFLKRDAPRDQPVRMSGPADGPARPARRPGNQDNHLPEVGTSPAFRLRPIDKLPEEIWRGAHARIRSIVAPFYCLPVATASQHLIYGDSGS